MRILLIALTLWASPAFAATYNFTATCYAPPCIGANDLTGSVTVEGDRVINYAVRSGDWTFSRADAAGEFIDFRPGGKTGIEYLSLHAYDSTAEAQTGRGFSLAAFIVPAGLWSQFSITNQGNCGNAECSMPGGVPSTYEGATPVPLPAPVLLLLAGLAALFGLKRARCFRSRPGATS